MDVQDADIVVMTCCGVTHNEENQAIEIIGNIERNRSQSAKFVIGGCLPAFAQKRILAVSPSALLLTYQQLDRLNELIGATTPLSEVYYNIHPTLDTELNEWIPNEEERVLQKIDELGRIRMYTKSRSHTVVRGTVAIVQRNWLLVISEVYRKNL